MSDDAQQGLNLLGGLATKLLATTSRRDISSAHDNLYAPALDAALQFEGSELDDFNATRRTVRDYSDKAIPRETILEICRVGYETSASFLGLGTASSRPRWLIFANALTNTDSGVYEFRDGGLFRVAPTPEADVMRWSSVAKGSMTMAPCIIQPVWDLGGELAVCGSDGYFNVLLSTGYCLHQSLLVAQRNGLVSCLFRGIHADVLSTSGTGGKIDSRGFLALSLGYRQTGDR